MIYIYDVYAYLQDIVYVIHDTEKKLIDAGAKITDVRIIPYDKSIVCSPAVEVMHVSRPVKTILAGEIIKLFQNSFIDILIKILYHINL